MATSPPPFPAGYNSQTLVAGAPGVGNGALVQSLSEAQAVYDAAFDQSALIAAINQDVLTVEQGLPEGTLVQFFLNNMGNAAGLIANTINSQYRQGKIIDPSTGAGVIPWPGESQIAYVQGNAVVLRWVKMLAPLVWIIIAIVAIAIIAGLWYLLSNTSYSLQKVAKTTSSILTFGGIVPWWVGGLALTGVGVMGIWYFGFWEKVTIAKAQASRVEVFTGGGR